MYRTNVIRARIVEVTNTMSYIASAVGLYCQEAGASGGAVVWPDCPDIAAIQSSLGLGLGGISRISNARIDQGTGTIEVTLGNIDGTVDGQTLTLIPTLNNIDGTLIWAWSGTVRQVFIPKR